LTLLCLTSVGQKQSVDTLITKIDNQQIVIMMQYVWFPKMFSPAGDDLVKIGKSVTDKLIPLLKDTSKGIIAHYILSNIWADKLKIAGQTLSSRVYPINDKADTLEILYSDFTFYQDNKRRNFAKQDDLDNNKIRWVSFFKTNTFKQQKHINLIRQ